MATRGSLLLALAARLAVAHAQNGGEGAVPGRGSPSCPGTARGSKLCSCLREGECLTCSDEIKEHCSNAMQLHGEDVVTHMTECHFDWKAGFCGHYDPMQPGYLSYTPMTPQGMAVIKAASIACQHPYEFGTPELGSFMNATGMGMFKGVFVDNQLSGKDMSELTVADLVDRLGVKLGMAKFFEGGRDQFLSVVQPVSKCGKPGETFHIDTMFEVNQLISVDEVKFEYKVAFSLTLAWTDENLWTTTCSAAVDDQIDQGSCAYIWKPPVAAVSSFVNVRPDDFTLLRRYMWTEPTETKTVIYQLDVVGTFAAPMGFQKYPSDKQELPISFQIDALSETSDLLYRRDRIKLHPVKIKISKFLTDSGDKDTLSGWAITGASAYEEASLEGDLTAIAKDVGGPIQNLVNYYIRMFEAAYPTRDGTLEMRKESTYSRATAIIHVERVTVFYMINYVMVIIVLTALSWVVFFVDATDLSDRVSFVMGLLIALNVFQLILVNIMPVTSYLTPMHELIIVSLFYTVLAAVESVIVHQLQKRQAVKAAVVEKIQASISSHAAAPNTAATAANTWTSKAKAAAVTESIVPSSAAADAEYGTAGNSSSAKPNRLRIPRVNLELFEKLLAENLDHACLVVFPITYAAYVATTFA